MDFIAWDKKLEINIEEIDIQHKKYFEIINKLYNESKKEKIDKKKLGEILYELVDYTGFHFSTEERYMQKYKYEDIEKHKEEHYKYKEKLAELARRFLKGEDEINMELFEFCKMWFFEHIKDIDKNLGKYLQKKGVALKKI